MRSIKVDVLRRRELPSESSLRERHRPLSETCDVVCIDVRHSAAALVEPGDFASSETSLRTALSRMLLVPSQAFPRP